MQGPPLLEKKLGIEAIDFLLLSMIHIRAVYIPTYGKCPSPHSRTRNGDQSETVRFLNSLYQEYWQH